MNQEDYPDTIEVEPEIASLFHGFKEEYEKFSGEEETVDGYMMRLLELESDQIDNYLLIEDFEVE